MRNTAFFLYSIPLLLMGYHTPLAAQLNLNDVQQCLNAITYYEQHYQIPTNLLHAISVVESGRWDDAVKKVVPWPWAANVDGTAYYFDSRREATDFVQRKLREGVGNIDIGCNQISWQYHGHNFNSLDQAFNPNHNARFAAQFLHQHYRDTKDWIKATGRYHSRTDSLASVYSDRVYKTWRSKLMSHAPSYISRAPSKPMRNPYHQYYTPYYERSSNTGAIIKVSSQNGTLDRRTPPMNHQLQQIAGITERVITKTQ